MEYTGVCLTFLDLLDRLSLIAVVLNHRLDYHLSARDYEGFRKSLSVRHITIFSNP